MLLNLIRNTIFRSPEVLETSLDWLKVDIHSHLLPGIDDGCKTLEESAQIIRQMQDLGYESFITTPHIMGDFYRNTPQIIRAKLQELKMYLAQKNINVNIEAAAEYYLDEWFTRLIENEEELLTFGDNYILFETGFNNRPRQLQEVVFALQSRGYKPVFAHPERYHYLYQDFETLQTLYEQGVLLQANLNSFVGYYGKDAKMLAERLLEANMLSFLGSDCHGSRHLDALEHLSKSKCYEKLTAYDWHNQSLIA